MTFEWPVGQWQPISGSFRLSSISTVSASPYTGAQKAISLGQIWLVEATFHEPLLNDAHDLLGFLNELEGPVNPVLLFDWWRPTPRLLSAGSSAWSDGTLWSDGKGWTNGYAPTLSAAAARAARSVLVSGLPASTECFKRGDLIGIGGYLYEIRAGVTADSTGAARLNIQPGLRIAAAVADMVTLYRPTVPMRLVSGPDSIERVAAHASPFGLTFAEDIP